MKAMRGGRLLLLIAVERAGKTTAAINHLIRDAMRVPNSLYGYIAPTYRLAKNVAWDILKQHAGLVHGVDFNEAELKAKFANGSRITLYGSDNPSALRGMGLWGVVFDEYSQQPSNIFTEIIRPALSDHKGYGIWIGTPLGRNDFYRLYKQSLTAKNWMGILLTVKESGLIDDEELADAKTSMSHDEFQQEFYCSFDASIKGAYYAKELTEARKEGRFGKVPYDSGALVHTVWDLGIRDSMAIGFFQKVGQEVRMIDYYDGNNLALPHYIKVLQKKDYVYGMHFAPHDIKVRELTTGKSRQETAQNMGIDFELTPDLSVQDGINAGRVMFKRMWVDETKCRIFLDYIAQYHKEWDDKKGMFKDKPHHDFTADAADMYRYASINEDSMINVAMNSGYDYEPEDEIITDQHSVI